MILSISNPSFAAFESNEEIVAWISLFDVISPPSIPFVGSQKTPQIFILIYQIILRVTQVWHT